ncbi:MAG: sulfurtransferase-like selenium metabolism protein YedF [Pseudomonadota bacterium]
MREIDCRGLACPQPVLKTKDALDEIREGRISVLVDNQAARENVGRFAKSQGCAVEVREDNGLFTLAITKGTAESAARDERKSPAPRDAAPSLVVGISNRFMGQGADELGRLLMKAFIKSLPDATIKPRAVVFYNSGVYLTCEGSENIEAIQALENSGVRVFSCGTCLDYFGLKDKLAVGLVTNMYEIIETLSGADRIVSP